MGLQDRDWWKDAQRERAKAARPTGGISEGLKWGPAGILVFWFVVMGGLYAGMSHFMKPKPVEVTASGDLLIPRARDGHFYAPGLINGKPVRFLIDTGATLVTVSEDFARSAGIAEGVPTVFKTANGELPGRIVPDVSITMGPLHVTGARIGVGLVGHNAQDALMGQSFLSKFEITVVKEQMILRRR